MPDREGHRFESVGAFLRSTTIGAHRGIGTNLGDDLPLGVVGLYPEKRKTSSVFFFSVARGRRPFDMVGRARIRREGRGPNESLGSL